ncbi:hypothetical protein HK101_002407, partial [Irineochytrium annulatum]
MCHREPVFALVQAQHANPMLAASWNPATAMALGEPPGALPGPQAPVGTAVSSTTNVKVLASSGSPQSLHVVLPDGASVVLPVTATTTGNDLLSSAWSASARCLRLGDHATEDARLIMLMPLVHAASDLDQDGSTDEVVSFRNIPCITDDALMTIAHFIASNKPPGGVEEREGERPRSIGSSLLTQQQQPATYPNARTIPRLSLARNGVPLFTVFLPPDATAEEVLDNVIKEFGLPRRSVSRLCSYNLHEVRILSRDAGHAALQTAPELEPRQTVFDHAASKSSRRESGKMMVRYEGPGVLRIGVRGSGSDDDIYYETRKVDESEVPVHMLEAEEVHALDIEVYFVVAPPLDSRRERTDA